MYWSRAVCGKETVIKMGRRGVAEADFSPYQEKSEGSPLRTISTKKKPGLTPTTKGCTKTHTPARNFVGQTLRRLCPQDERASLPGPRTGCRRRGGRPDTTGHCRVCACDTPAVLHVWHTVLRAGRWCGCQQRENCPARVCRNKQYRVISG